MSDVRTAVASAARYTIALMDAWLSELSGAPIDGILQNTHADDAVRRHLQQHSTPERRRDAGGRLFTAFKNWANALYGGDGKLDVWVLEHSAEYADINGILGKVVCGRQLAECMQNGVHVLALVHHAMVFVVAMIQTLARTAIHALPDIVVMQTDVCHTVIGGACRAWEYIERVYRTKQGDSLLPDRDTLPTFESMEAIFNVRRLT